MALEERRRSASVPTRCSRRVEPSMSVNRKVTVPARRRRRLGHRGVPSGRAVSGRCASVRSRSRRGDAAQDGQGDRAARSSEDRLEVPGREGQAGRRPVGDDLRDRAAGRRGRTARRRTRPGRACAIVSPSRTTRTPPVDDDEEPGPDLALAGDHVLGREVDLDRAAGDPIQARPRRRRRTAGPPPAARPCGRGSGSSDPPVRLCGPCCAARAAGRQPRAARRRRHDAPDAAPSLARMTRHGRTRGARRRDRRVRAVRRPDRPAARGRRPHCSRRPSSRRASGSSARA